MERSSALILGGGAVGLAAANYLSKNSIAVTFVEARDRLGGRIHTTRLLIPRVIKAPFMALWLAASGPEGR
jgi:monoamine oxidase